MPFLEPINSNTPNTEKSFSAELSSITYANSSTGMAIPDISSEIPALQGDATILFALAVIHTFCVKRFLALAHRFPEGSIRENLCHFLGEVEVVFGIWAAILLTIWSFTFSTESVVTYLDSVNFTEPAFVFVIMCMAATRPILWLAGRTMRAIARVLPLSSSVALYCTVLVVGPLLGSLITEPAAMTVTALLLKEAFYEKGLSTKLSYATLGLLFVNVSIGGTLTHFAAPPVLMVARPWGWDTPFMLLHFGDRAAASILISTALTAYLFRKELATLDGAPEKPHETQIQMTLWMSLSHILFIALTVLHSHHMSFFIPLFLFFLGWVAVSKEYQDEIRLKESLLVAFFLGGLVTLGQLQSWWLQPTLSGMSEGVLFWGATALTAVTDNAALTYLGTLVPTLSDGAKLALVGGAVTGGGLTVIANAPNPAGYSILSPHFGDDGISPLWLFIAALPSTLLAALAMHLL